MPARKKTKTKKPALSKPKKAAKTRVKKTEKRPKATTKRTSAPSAKKKSPPKRPLKKKTALKKHAERKKGAAVKDRMQNLKKELIERREAIVREAKAEIAKYMSGENRQLVDTALDEGDWAVVDISEDINLMRLSAHRKALHDIDEVLRKIKEGTYGICEECGEEISEKRLSVIPTASFCISCQGNKEQFEAIQREEQP